MKRAGLHTGPHVYHKMDQGGLATVPVLNLTDNAVTLRPGLGLGMFEHAKVEKVKAKPKRVKGPTTAKQKKEEYLRQLVANSKEEKRKKEEKKGFDAAKATPVERECSVGQATTGGSHTSFAVDGTRTPWVRELGRSVLWFHMVIVYSEVYTHLWYKSYCLTIYF